MYKKNQKLTPTKFFTTILTVAAIVLINHFIFRIEPIIIDPALDEFIAEQRNMLPVTDNHHQIIHHSAYSLSYNEAFEQANWVLYQLTNERVINGKTKRADDFREDKKVNTGSATLSDYYKSNYDRGHLAPAGDMKSSKRMMSESFYMSNMSPQVAGFNRGIWRKLEEQTRNWAKNNEVLYVVTGPVLTDGLKTIGENKVAVPNYYYKIIVDVSLPEGKAIAFIMENKASKKALKNYVVTIDSIENLTGIDFFYQLPDSLENKLEGKNYPRQWGFN